MPKCEPKPYWKASHSCWYVNIAGKTIRLDPDETKAQAEYHRVMSGKRESKNNPLVLEVIAAFLEHSKRTNAPRTVEWYTEHLESFYKHVGRLRVQSLKPAHVTKWVSKRFPKSNNGTTIGNAMRCVKRALNWAKSEGELISENPLAGMKLPPATARDVYLTQAQFDLLAAAIKDECFRDFVTIMRQTGCRPTEARRVEARHFDREGKCWVIPRIEAKGNREERIVVLNDLAFAITQKLSLKYPTGPLFRNRSGRPWTPNALDLRCIRLSRKLDFHVCPYAIRSVFAMEAIINARVFAESNGIHESCRLGSKALF